jgi:hypothetical protein
MGLRDRLQPRPLADDLVAPGYLPPQPKVRASATQTSGRKLLA